MTSFLLFLAGLGLGGFAALLAWFFTPRAAAPSGPVYRCKHRKTPGDGGVVDGCGWEGTLERDGQPCPSCRSRLLYRVKEAP